VEETKEEEPFDRGGYSYDDDDDDDDELT